MHHTLSRTGVLANSFRRIQECHLQRERERERERKRAPYAITLFLLDENDSCVNVISRSGFILVFWQQGFSIVDFIFYWVRLKYK